ncbi:MAG: peptide deformylase, partial [bacterium]
MSVLNVATYPAAVLRKKTRPVKRFDDQLKRVVDDMFETMSLSDGIGLAAPQIGKSKKIIVVDTMEPGGRHALVNPKILWTSKDQEPFKEG